MGRRCYDGKRVQQAVSVNERTLPPTRRYLNYEDKSKLGLGISCEWCFTLDASGDYRALCSESLGISSTSTFTKTTSRT